MANEPNPRRVLVQGMAYGSCEGCVRSSEVGRMTKKYITAPPINVGMCYGCAFRAFRGPPDCVNHSVGLGLPRCCDHKYQHLHVFVEDTPEGRAAYVAEKLERANEPTR